MNNRYKELLCKYASNKEVEELIELVVLDDFRVREDYYTKNKQYPQRQDLLSKLKVDLKTTEYFLNKSREE